MNADYIWKLVLLTTLASTSLAQDRIAGLTPYERPADAPRITADPTPDRARMLRGITDPVPPSLLQFLDDQGGWYTPFNRPGMTPPYDLRGWHAPPTTYSMTR